MEVTMMSKTMTEEQKKADAEFEEWKKEKIEAKDTSEEKAEAEEEETPKEEPLQIDHEAELKKEREKREEAERKLEETRDKARERFKKKEEVEVEDEPQDKPVTVSELTSILAKDRQDNRKELQASTIALKAKELAGKDASEAEVQRIIETHRERTFPSYLSLDKQLEESYAIVNSPRIIAQNSELKRSLLSKDTKGTGDEGVTKDAPKIGEPTLETSFRTELQKAGFLWDGKQFKKKLESGKVLIKDYKSGKVHVE